ncbi:MAG: hypothetical protein ACM31C_10025 [Acidobacteriota bacterium]
MRRPEWLPAAAVAAALAVLVAWSFGERWDVLAESPFPVGVDGYFYPIELRSLLAHGTLQYPASPLTFWWMAPFAALTDPITGAKLGAALGGALVALPAYGVGARLGRHRAAGLLAAVVATASAGSAYLSIEFVKQGIGLTVALTALWLVLRAAETPSRRRLAAAAAAIVATLLAHKLAAAIVIAIAVPVLVEEARSRGTLRGRRLLYVVGAVAAAGIAIGVLGIVFPQRFASAADVGKLGRLLTSHARWDGAALATPHLVLAFDHEAAIGGVLALAAAATLVLGKRGSRGERVCAWCFVGLALAIALPWLDVADPQGVAMRLRVAAFVPLAACAAIVAGELLARWPKHAEPAVYVVAIAVLGLPRDRTEGRVVAHPALVASALALADHVPAHATVIVPERHVEFMIAWYTGAPVSARPERVPYAQRVRVLLPLSSASTRFPLAPALAAARAEPLLDPPLDLHPRARDGFVLVSEATWDWMLAQMPDRLRRHWAAWPTI